MSERGFRARGLGALLMLGWLYGVALLAILLARWHLGDVTPRSFAINALLLYCFVPIPAVLVLALAMRRASLLALAASGACAAAYLWGSLFMPRWEPRATSREPQLTVMSYNVLGYNLDTGDTLRVIRESGADLIALQELNPETAAAIERELGDAYPYRWLDARHGVKGGGIISKHSFERMEPQPLTSASWVGLPMGIELSVEGRRLTVVRFHAAAGPEAFRLRERQARALAQVAKERSGPLILVGDLNATDQNSAYAMIAAELLDAWREAGFGLGHTFPGEPTARVGGSRPTLLGIPVPLWLVRIDYIFHSRDLKAVDARTAPYYGGSDHRGVIATLALP